jgi:hypothetical protein
VLTTSGRSPHLREVPVPACRDNREFRQAGQPERATALAAIAAVIAKDDAARAKEILAIAENLAVATPEDSKTKKANRVSALCAVAIAAALVDRAWSQRLVAGGGED